MRFRIEHETNLAFSTPIQEQFCELRLQPFTEAGLQVVESFELTVAPSVPVRRYHDAFGNAVHHFEVLPEHGQLVTRAHSVVETFLSNPFGYLLPEPVLERQALESALRSNPDVWPYVWTHSAAVPPFKRLPATSDAPGWTVDEPLQAAVLRGMGWVASRLRYQQGSSEIDAPLETIWAGGKGVCQDFAHAFISLLRSWSVPARYVMGYANVQTHDQAELASHAWVDVWMPTIGWRGFDPTNQLAVNDNYIRVAVGRDYLDASPQRGTFKGQTALHSPQVKLILTPAEEPRVLVGSGPSVSCDQ